ncbi:hypothetical protein [Mycobacterium palustre]|uniref:hypothetical protein n=1 Tax=Mycobacterium palustre TaxID=153971 RepID=UPI000A15677D|nr:hypothetical protein [Mycobacterium palustre]
MPGAIVTAVLTALVGAGVTWSVLYLRHVEIQPDDAVKLSVETDPADTAGGNYSQGSAIIPSDIRTHGTPGAGCRGFHSWVADNHGADRERTVVQIVAQNRTDKPVLVQRMRVTIVDGSPPLTGIAVSCTDRRPAAAEPRQLAVNLDAAPPGVEYISGPSKAPFGFTLANGQTESFVVSAFGTRATYRWKIDFEIVVDGVATTVPVGDKEGFTTAAGLPSCGVAPAGKPCWSYTD